MKRFSPAVIKHSDLVEFHKLSQLGFKDVEDEPIKVVRISLEGTDTADIAMYADELAGSTFPQPVYDIGIWRGGNVIAATGALAGIPPLMSAVAMKGENGHADSLLPIDIDSLAGQPGESPGIAFLPLDNEEAYRWAQRAHVCPEATSLKLGAMALYAFDISRLADDQVTDLRRRAARILAEIRKKTRLHTEDHDPEDDATSVFAP